MKKPSRKPGKASKAKANRDPGGSRINPDHEPNGAGIDVGAEFISVAVPEKCGEAPWVRDFDTFTGELEKAARWLLSCGIKSVVMESTGSYWIPIYDVLERHGIICLLVSAHSLKNVPGRKSDCVDARWLQLLHSCGLLRGAFRPPATMLGLRSLIRHRAGMVRESTQHLQRMDKLLTEMNLRLKLVISSLHTDTAQRIITAIAEGERDPARLAALRDERCKHSLAEIKAALTGNWKEASLWLLRLEHQAWQHSRRQIAELEAEIQRMLEASEPVLPVESASPEEAPQLKEKLQKKALPSHLETVIQQSRRLFGCNITTLPGISAEKTLELMGELGSREVLLKNFRDEHRFAAWIALAPRPDISGGKQLAGKKHRKMSVVGRIFDGAAFPLGRGHGLLDAEIRRRKAAGGKSWGIRVIAHKLARIFYAMVKNRCDYNENLAFPDRDIKLEKSRKHLEKKAAAMGFVLVPAKAEADQTGA
jgi:transposase